jgi:hypothetical protein
MKSLIITAILSVCTLAAAQTAIPAFVVPGVDGISICEVNNLLGLCSPASTGLWAGVTYDSQTNTYIFPNLSAATLSLTGGATLAPGEYVLNVPPTGDITLVPFVSPTPKVYTVTIAATSLSSGATATSNSVTVPGLSTATGAIPEAFPEVNPGAAFWTKVNVSGTSVTVTVINLTSLVQAFPKTTFSVKVY